MHISTDEVFGSLGKSGLFNESSNYKPKSPYSATKAASDHLVDSWFHTFGLPSLISNCSNNYGPRQFPDKLIRPSTKPLKLLIAFLPKGERKLIFKFFISIPNLKFELVDPPQKPLISKVFLSLSYNLISVKKTLF